MTLTNEQLNLLRGNFTKIANKNSCSRDYVSKIAHGHRNINTEKAKRVAESIENILNVLTK